MGKHGKRKPGLRATPRPEGTRPKDGGAPGIPPAETELRRGLTAFQRGDYGEAIQAWRQARRAGAPAAVDQALAEASFRRALAAGNAARRAQELQEAVALAPDRAIYQFHLGLTHHREGHLRRALAASEEAHRLAPGDDRIRRHLALFLCADPAATQRVHDLLAEAPPGDEGAARLRALAHLQANQPEAAVATLAARKHPSPLATLALGLARLAAGQTEAAQADLLKVHRMRRPLGAEARQAAAVGAIVAQGRGGDLTGALKTLGKHDLPTEAELRRASATASRRLAVALVLDERADEAVFALGRALAADPKHELTRRCQEHLHEVLGVQAARRGDFAAAAGHWAAALATDPGNARVRRNLALAEERLERWSQASAHWDELARQWKKELHAARRPDEVAELRSRLAVAHRHLAGTYEAADNLPAARQTLERSLNFDPSNVDLRLHAAELYLVNEDFTGAIDHLRRVLAARPGDVRVLLELGSAYQGKGDERQAVSYLEQALALEPENRAAKAAMASVHHDRGHRLVDNRRADQAAAEFGRAAELDPDDPEHCRCLGELYLKLGRLDAAGPAFERARAIHPHDPILLTSIGRDYLKHGHEQEAERFFRESLRFDDSFLGRTAIGLTYLRLGHPAKAATYLEPVLKGRNSFLLAMVGSMYIEAGQAEQGLPYLERAVELDPFNLEARLELAYIHAVIQGDTVQASSELSNIEGMARAMGKQKLLETVTRIREVNAL